MATGQPKTKASELLGRLGALAEFAHPDDLELARIRREAEGLRKSDPAEASAVLGTLAALNYDEDETRRQFELAQRLAPREIFVAANYAFSLFRYGYFREAAERYRSAHDLVPTDVLVLDKTIESYAIIGRFDEARELDNLRSKIVRENVHPWHSEILRAPEYLQSHAVNEQDIEELVNVATSILRKSRIPIIGVALLNMADEESEWMSIHLIIDEPVPVIVDLDVELAKVLAGQDSPMNAEYHLTVMYMTKG